MHKTRMAQHAGFTLIELTVAMGIFAVLVVGVAGIMIGVSNAQMKVANIQAVVDNVRFSLELINKEMLRGYFYNSGTYCGGPGIEFQDADSPPRRLIYYHDAVAGKIMRIVAAPPTPGAVNCNNAIPFTADEVDVEFFNVTLTGQQVGRIDGQPRATILIRAHSTNPKTLIDSTMNIQTTITQRIRDI